MDVLEKIEVKQKELYDFLNKPAANQGATEQLEILLKQSQCLQDKLAEFKHENHRRPSKEHKQTRADLKLVDKEVNKIRKAIKKCNALKEAALHLGNNHGKVMLNKTRYHW